MNSTIRFAGVLLLLAGPMEVPHRRILKSDPTKRQFVYCISHSRWNDEFASNYPLAFTQRSVIELEVRWVQIRDQNRLLSFGRYGRPDTFTEYESAMKRWRERRGRPVPRTTVLITAHPLRYHQAGMRPGGTSTLNAIVLMMLSGTVAAAPDPKRGTTRPSPTFPGQTWAQATPEPQGVDAAAFVSIHPNAVKLVTDGKITSARVVFNLPYEEYLKQYFIGHYNPRGNHLFAYSIKDMLVQWLDPKPITYRKPDPQAIDFIGYLPDSR